MSYSPRGLLLAKAIEHQSTRGPSKPTVQDVGLLATIEALADVATVTNHDNAKDNSPDSIII